MAMKESPKVLLLIGLAFVVSMPFASVAHTMTKERRGNASLDDADPEAIRALIMHDVGNVRMTLSNWGEQGNPDGVVGFRGFEFPINSGNDFLFSAGVWIGAILNEQRLVSTGTDGDNGTNEFWPVHIGTYPAENAEPSFGDWYLSSNRLDMFNERYFVLGEMGRDDDGDWNPSSDDLSGDGMPSPNYDGGRGFIGFDDDADGLVDEEATDGMDNDGDGQIDEDTNDRDVNGDGNCSYDPEPHVDEDPVGDISHDYLDNDSDGLVDIADDDLDGDQNPGSLDDDGDGLLDEDGNAHSPQEFFCVYQDDIQPQYVGSPDVDGHTPLDIEVTQRSNAWPYLLPRDVILVEYRIRNVGALPLESVYLALFADPDIAAAGEGGDDGSLDDYNYYDAARHMMVQYDAIDDDDGWGPGVLGIQVVQPPIPWEDMRFTFANFERVSGGDPQTNMEKYSLISSADISPPTAQQGDWRMLMGFGAESGDLSLAPGEELSFTVAFIAGTDTTDVAAKAERTWFFGLGPIISDQTLITSPNSLGPYVVSAFYADETGVDWQHNIHLNWRAPHHGALWTAAEPYSHVWTDPATFSGTYYFMIPDTHADGSSVAYGDTILFFCDGYDLLMNYSAHPMYTLIAGEELVHVKERSAPVPRQFTLHQNFPNPFNASTQIVYDLVQPSHVSMKIFDLLGREVITLVNKAHATGSYTVSWDATGLPSGIYLCQMEAEGYTQARKLLLVK
jgi:hypothetical protein